MTNRIEYIFLEVPNCLEPYSPGVGPLDYVCYTLGHISEMTERPEWAVGEFYDLLFNSAEISNFAPSERNEYRKDMTTERDIKNQIAFAEKKGKVETAKNLLAMGMSPEDISKATGLPIEEIKTL